MQGRIHVMYANNNYGRVQHIWTRTTIMDAYNNYGRVQQLCTRTTIMYAYNNYVRIQQKCTRTTIMYAYNNYVRIQQLCTRITIMYAYNNKVCVNCSTWAHVRVQYTHKLTRAHTLCIVSKNALPPHPEKIEMTSLLFHRLNKSAVVSLSNTHISYVLVGAIIYMTLVSSV